MTTTTLTFAWGEDNWTEVEVTYHRTGPAFIITNIVEEYGWPRVPDHEWETLEEAARVHVGELVDEAWQEDQDCEVPGADVLAGICREIIAAERRLGA